MRVLPINSISFKSIPIYDVKLKKQNEKGEQQEIKAQFSILDRNDDEDQKLVSDFALQPDNDYFGVPMLVFFSKKYKADFSKDFFYAIEGKNNNGQRMIYSMAQVSPQYRFIRFLQSNVKNASEGIKGAGEVMLWGIGKDLGEEEDKDYIVRLNPTPNSRGFYEKIGLTSGKEEGFFLSSADASHFFRRIEKKYNL